MTVWLVPAPPRLVRRARALLTDGRTGGTTLAALLPAGLSPGPGWPGAEDLIGLSRAAEPLLVVVGGKVVGGLGPKGPPDSGGAVEIGYGLVPAWRGRGVGTAAVRLLLDLLAARGVRSVLAQVEPANAGSLRLLDRLGFVPVPGPDDGHLWRCRQLPAGPDGEGGDTPRSGAGDLR